VHNLHDILKRKQANINMQKLNVTVRIISNNG